MFPGCERSSRDLSCLIRERVRNIYFYISTKKDNLLFIKYIKHRGMAYLLEAEYKNIKYLLERLNGVTRKSITELCLLENLDGCYQVMFLNYIKGKPMSETFMEFNQENVVKTETNINEIMKWLVGFQKQTEVARVSAESLVPDVESLLSGYQQICPESNVEHFFRESVVNRLLDLKGLELPFVCSHGDFYPSNILMDNGDITVIDWADMEKEALPTYDIFTFFLSFRHANKESKRTEILIRSFEAVFFASGEFSRLAEKSLKRYCADTGLDREVLSLLFPVYLLKQALYESTGVFDNQGKRMQHWAERLQFYLENRDKLIMSLQLQGEVNDMELIRMKGA
jgi:hypothetical protein